MSNTRLRQIENIAMTAAAVAVIVAAVYGYILAQREMIEDAKKIGDAVRNTSPEAAVYRGD